MSLNHMYRHMSDIYHLYELYGLKDDTPETSRRALIVVVLLSRSSSTASPACLALLAAGQARPGSHAVRLSCACADKPRLTRTWRNVLVSHGR